MIGTIIANGAGGRGSMDEELSKTQTNTGILKILLLSIPAAFIGLASVSLVVWLSAKLSLFLQPITRDFSDGTYSFLSVPYRALVMIAVLSCFAIFHLAPLLLSVTAGGPSLAWNNTEKEPARVTAWVLPILLALPIFWYLAPWLRHQLSPASDQAVMIYRWVYVALNLLIAFLIIKPDSNQRARRSRVEMDEVSVQIGRT
jgi:hypothetical protein